MTTALKDWLKRHPLLEPIARLESTVGDLVKTLPRPVPERVSFEPYAADFQAGVALLRSAGIGRKLLHDSADTFDALMAAFPDASIPEALTKKSRELRDHLHKSPGQIGPALASIATGAEEASNLPHLGVARYIAWKALSHALAPTLADFAAWREKADWRYGHCPACGARPVLAALTPKDESRQRSLVCGLCETRWPAPRFGCPYCGSEEEDKLAIFELEEEPDVRLDVCNDCKGYLKTWAGPAEIAPYFCDWATLHLDAMAAERGYLRLGASLYEL